MLKRFEKLLVEPLVYVILDVDIADDPVKCGVEVAAAGGRLLQLRAKNWGGRQMVELARQLKAELPSEALLIVNDRVDVALAAGADGVHVGPEDLSISDVRKIAPNLIVGGSARSAEVAMELERQGAHYLGSGAVYDAHAIKPNASEPQGPELIRRVMEAVDIPVFGIGGINAQNVRPVIEAGASGVAVIREVVASGDSQAAYRQLLTAARNR